MQKRDEELFELALPVVEGMGFALVGVDDVVEHGRRVFRFYVDHTRGVGIQDCASVSREIDYLLDARLDFDAPYVLEVSSPGLDHRLKHVREYEHFAGRQARVVLREPLEGRNVLQGVLVGADANGVRIATQEGREITLALSDIARAHLVP